MSDEPPKVEPKLSEDESEPSVELPLGYLLWHVDDWTAFCSDIDLNPWVLKEGIASDDDTHPVSVAMLKKHGVLPK